MRWKRDDYYISRNYWNANDNADFTECARCGSKKIHQGEQNVNSKIIVVLTVTAFIEMS